jgi:hypothetical protein
MPSNTVRITRKTLRALAFGAVGLLISSGNMGVSCDSDAQAVFRQTATTSLGQGVKEFLGGDPDQAVNTLVTATIDGVVASVVQAGDGPPASK